MALILVSSKKHMLGAAQADALRAERAALLGVARGIRVRPDLELAVLVRPAHETAEVAGDGSRGGRNGLGIDVAGGAVDGNVVAFLDGQAGERELLVGIVDNDVAAAGDAAGAHAAGHNGRVGGHAAANGQDALCNSHALDVLRRGLETDENDLLAVFMPGLRVLSGEHDLAAGSAGGGSQALADDLGLLHGLGIELRVQQSVELLRLHAQHSLFLVDHALVHEVDGDLQSSGGGALAVTGLQHVELAVLDGELHVLHVLVVLLEGGLQWRQTAHKPQACPA